MGDKQKNIYLRRLWNHIRNRCYNSKDTYFHDYGGRGIEMDSRWPFNFDLFLYEILNTLGHRPDPTYQLDRINNNGHYELSNLRWVDKKTNASNRRNNRLLGVNGEIKTIKEWATIYNLNYKTLLKRVNKNISPEKLFLPVKIKSKSNAPPYYKLWANIKQRCHNENNQDYYRYGARGIFLYEPWRNSFKEFQYYILNTLGDRTNDSYQLDRIDNDGSYVPGNIRWVTPSQNNKNKNNNVIINIGNKNVVLADLSIESRISASTIKRRIKDNWPEDKWLIPLFKKRVSEEMEIIIDDLYLKYKNISKISKELNISASVIRDVVKKEGAYFKGPRV